VYRRAELTGRPCLLGDIGKCAAPCVGRISPEDHKSLAIDFASFMAGNDSGYLRDLTEKMKQAASTMDYEAAARHRDAIQALEGVLGKSAVVLPETIDADVFGIAHDELAAAVQQFIVRGGRVRGVRSWVVDKELDMDLGELVETVVQNAYDGPDAPPREILVPELPEDTAELEQWLTQRRRETPDPSAPRGRHTGRVELRTAQRGDKAALAQTVEMNAKNALVLYKTRRSSDFVARSKALNDIQDALGMADAPLRMECYDVSHLSGTNIVASMVVFEDGLPRRDQYRRFSIPESTDDTESIYQVISRRLAYLRETPAAGTADSDETALDAAADEEAALDAEGAAGADEVVEAAAERRRRKFSYPPNLLIVDGGQPQVAAAKRALDESGVTGIQLAGIAKRLEEIWLPDSDFPVILPRNSDALFLIQRLRDEAHRFAITYQRARRKRDIGTVLGEIPGLGPSRVKELLKHFGSVAQLRKASPEQIAEVRGVGPTLATAIFERLAEGGRADTADAQRQEGQTTGPSR
jgi:excinuclease ABC subunit C